MKHARELVSALITAGAVIHLGSAMAADLPITKAPPMVATVYSWTGFYLGANAGAALGRSDTATTAAVLPNLALSYFQPTDIPALQSAGAQSIKSTTVTGGLTAGYNWEVANFVVGLEADFNYFGAKGSKTGSSIYAGFAAGPTITSSTSSDWLMTLRPRVGVLVTPALLLYGTAGLAVADLRGRFNFTDNFPTAAGGATESAAISTTRVGWTAGAGGEYALLNGWSVKAEYLYVDLGRATTTSANLVSATFGPLPGNVFTQSTNLHANIARVGFNYKWGDQVIARY
jgi:outer membrane immunogenic protein